MGACGRTTRCTREGRTFSVVNRRFSAKPIAVSLLVSASGQMERLAAQHAADVRYLRRQSPRSGKGRGVSPPRPSRAL